MLHIFQSETQSEKMKRKVKRKISNNTREVNNYFNGIIDDVRVYNYARSAEQIKQDYNKGLVRIG